MPFVVASFDARDRRSHDRRRAGGAARQCVSDIGQRLERVGHFGSWGKTAGTSPIVRAEARGAIAPQPQKSPPHLGRARQILEGLRSYIWVSEPWPFGVVIVSHEPFATYFQA